MKKVRIEERTKVFKGNAIVRTDEGLKTIDLGTVKSGKRLTDVGAKKEFEKHPDIQGVNLIGIEITKLPDEVTTYEMDIEQFKATALKVVNGEM